MSSLLTPQKFHSKPSLPPKPSTPKNFQKPVVNFENLQSTPHFTFSPRNTTPIKANLFEASIKRPLKSNNSSPSHRRSNDVFSNTYSEESKKIHEMFSKVENEKEKLKAECENSSFVITDLEQKLGKCNNKLKKKSEKIKFLTLLLKETENQFKIVLGDTNRDLEKIIQDQALKIKELNETLKTQQKELSLK